MYAGRFSMICTGRFGRGQQWQALIAALEGSLRLHCHSGGTITGLVGYLHGRTGGMIGSLLRLVRAAAIQPVLDGTEAITKATPESIPVDIASAGITCPDDPRARRPAGHHAGRAGRERVRDRPPPRA
jgi:hypothetical protein